MLRFNVWLTQINELPAHVSTTDFPGLETGRLILRAITLHNRFAIFENYSDPAVAGWFFGHSFAYIEQAQQIINDLPNP